MFEHHFIAADFIHRAMRDALEGSGPTGGSSRDAQEILRAAKTPRPTGWLESILRRWGARRPAARSEAGSGC